MNDTYQCERNGEHLRSTRHTRTECTQTVTYRDRNGSYTPGTYSDGREVHVYGTRNGFTYFAFDTDLGWVTKTPASWVTVTPTN